MEIEIGQLRKERSLMMREVVELQHQQRGTIAHMEVLKEKLEAAEKRQKQMVSFLSRMFQNPAFVARLQQMREKKSITSPRSIRKFVKHQPGTSTSSSVTFRQLHSNLLRDMGDSQLFLAEGMCSQDVDSVLKGKGVMGSQPQSKNNYFISFAEDLVTEKSIPEFSIGGTESMAMGDGWSVGFEGGGAALSSSTTEPWGNLSLPEVGVSSELSNIWDIERWLDEDSSFN